jgi:hypothetical protein
MTPKEKAIELVQKFKQYSYYDAHDLTSRFQRERSNIDSAKECAEICIDEIIAIYKKNDGPEGSTYINEGKFFWMRVKKQIENI